MRRRELMGQARGFEVQWNQRANVYNLSFSETNSTSSKTYPIISDNNAITFIGIKTGDKLLYKWDITYDTIVHTPLYSPQGNSFGCYSDVWGYKYINTAIANATENGGLHLRGLNPGETCSGTCSLQIYNLTQMFGSGNEPTTVAEFESWLTENGINPNEYIPYNSGETRRMTKPSWIV